MEFGQQMQEAKDNAKLSFYQNINYQYERLKNKTITIHMDDFTTASKIYRLIEPLRIDKLSDVYIDSFISNNLLNTAGDAEVFVLGIKEFNIQSVSNKSIYNNKLIIPNTSGTAGADNTIAHRATKFNYIGSINPITLSSLEISLTKSNGSSAIEGSGDVWVTFMIVARD
jgi:hypothetical protein